MPVRSENSLMYFCTPSPRGPLMRSTSSFVPAYFFHCGSAKAGRPTNPSAPAAADAFSSFRREMARLDTLFSSYLLQAVAQESHWAKRQGDRLGIASRTLPERTL